MKPKLIEILKTLQISSGGLDSNKTREKYLKEHDLYNDIMYYSKELETDSLNERIYFIVNDLSIEDTKCKNPNCQNKAKYNNYLKGYRDTCSIECGSRYRDIKTIEKRRNKYKSEIETRYPTKKFEIKDWNNTSDDIKVTCERNHVAYMSYDKINYKCICEECLEEDKYTDFVQKANEKHNHKYTYERSNDPKTIILICKDHSKSEINRSYHLDGTGCRKCSNRVVLNKYHLQEYIDENDLKIKVLGEYKNSIEQVLCKCLICNEKFYNKPNNIMNGSPGCESCSRNMITKKQFLEKIKKYPNVEYLGGYVNKSTKCNFKCKIHDIEFKQLPRYLFEGVKTCYKCQTNNFRSNAEIEVFEYAKQYSSDTKNNDRTLIKKELDILVPNKFAIEYNGLLWHSYNPYQFPNVGQIEYKNKHLDKTELCEEKGIQLFHIFENEWLDPVKQEIWKSVINSKLGLHKRIYARKTEIRMVETKEKDMFLDNNHLQGTSVSGINIGLYYENELVSIMTFGKSRFSKKYKYELLRFASKLNTTVIGGGSKLIKFFEDTYKPSSLISYANRRWSTGNFYEQVEFTFEHNSSPNYFYFKEGSLTLESRNKYQKHKLHKVLDIFDENKSESENMFLNGYRRIYDSGNKIYIKYYK